MDLLSYLIAHTCEILYFLFFQTVKTEYGETEKDNQKEGNVKGKGKAWSSKETKGAKAHFHDTDVYSYYINYSL